MLGLRTSDFVKLRLRGCLRRNVKDGEQNRFLGNEYPYYAYLSIHGVCYENASPTVQSWALRYTKGYVWRCATCGVEKNGQTLDTNHRFLRLGGDNEPAKYYRMIAELHDMPWDEDDYDANAED